MDQKCRVCNEDFQTTPILLPCGWTVCDLHLKNNELFNCVICQGSHKPNDRAYIINKYAAIFCNKRKIRESLEIINECMAKLKQFHNNPNESAYEYFDKLIGKIEK